MCITKKSKGTADAIVCAKKYIKNKNVLILFGDVPLYLLLQLQNFLIIMLKMDP